MRVFKSFIIILLCLSVILIFVFKAFENKSLFKNDYENCE